MHEMTRTRTFDVPTSRLSWSLSLSSGSRMSAMYWAILRTILHQCQVTAIIMHTSDRNSRTNRFAFKRCKAVHCCHHIHWLLTAWVATAHHKFPPFTKNVTYMYIVHEWTKVPCFFFFVAHTENKKFTVLKDYIPRLDCADNNVSLPLIFWYCYILYLSLEELIRMRICWWTISQLPIAFDVTDIGCLDFLEWCTQFPILCMQSLPMAILAPLPNKCTSAMCTLVSS